MNLLVSIAFLVLLFSLRSQGMAIPGVCFGLTIVALCISVVVFFWKMGKSYGAAKDNE